MRTWPRRWIHGHTAPNDLRVQKSPSCGVGTSIRRPFLRPVRVRTARSSPRLTFCNTVWREVPRAGWCSGCRGDAQSVAVTSAMAALAEAWSTRFLPAPAVAIRAAVQMLFTVLGLPRAAWWIW
jgi:hypothetical protein